MLVRSNFSKTHSSQADLSGRPKRGGKARGAEGAGGGGGAGGAVCGIHCPECQMGFCCKPPGHDYSAHLCGNQKCCHDYMAQDQQTIQQPKSEDELHEVTRL